MEVLSVKRRNVERNNLKEHSALRWNCDWNKIEREFVRFHFCIVFRPPSTGCVYLFDVLCKFLWQSSTNYLSKCTQLLITSSNNRKNLFLDLRGGGKTSSTSFTRTNKRNRPFHLLFWCKTSLDHQTNRLLCLDLLLSSNSSSGIYFNLETQIASFMLWAKVGMGKEMGTHKKFIYIKVFSNFGLHLLQELFSFLSQF